jgi:hypothetical protein
LTNIVNMKQLFPHYVILLLFLSAPGAAAQGSKDTVYRGCGYRPLSNKALVPANGAPSSILFAIDVQMEIGWHPVEKMRVSMIRVPVAGKSDTAVFYYKDKWQLQFSKGKNCASVKHPVVTATGEPAVGDQKGVCFLGQVTINNTFSKVILVIELMSTLSGVVISEGEHEIVLQEVPVQDTLVMKEMNTFSAYPNPTQGWFMLRGLLGENSSLGITLLDASGKPVAEMGQGIFSGSYERLIDLGNLAPGIYFISITVNGRQQVIRIICV